MINVLFGNEPYRIKHFLDKLKSKQDADIIEFSVLEKEVFELARQYPMMSGHRLIIVTLDNLKSTDEFLSYLREPSDFTDIVIVCGSVDKRTKLYKEMKDKNIVKEFCKLDEEELKIFVLQLLRKENGQITEESYRYFIERIGYMCDETITLFDVEKSMEQMLFNSKLITKELINNFVEESFTNNIFILADCLLEKKSKEVFAYMDKFLQRGENAIGILSLLLRNFRLAYKKSLYADKSDIQVAELIGVPVYQIHKVNFKSVEMIKDVLSLLQGGVNQIKAGSDDRIVLTLTFAKILTALEKGGIS